MLFQILSIIGCLISLCFAAYQWIEYRDFGGSVAICFVGCFLSLLLSALIYIIVYGIGCLVSEKEWTEPIASDKLIAFNDDTLTSTTTHGGVFVRTVRAEETLKYEFIYEDSMGIHLGVESINNAIIKETNDNFRVERIQKRMVNPVWRWLLGDMRFDDTLIFYIPEGSIINEYSVDLE